ncbi:MAG TPA: hypothetical protein VGN98_02795 [Tianweitania sediminis]|jgi:hypothetical protein|nr:hypothetical protein [Tianweitania sediminis]
MSASLIIAEANARAQGHIVSVKVLADTLAGMMAELHGETWKAFVEHETGFILIRPLNEKRPIPKPSRGEAA